MTTAITTKYGTARIYGGYFRISSFKEGNNRKFLHKLIYEDVHKVTLLDWATIHHIDGNKTNNDISNLEAMSRSEHAKLHATGQSLPKESRLRIGKKISQMNNTTGFFRVSIQKDNTSQGFSWRYVYPENGKRRVISSTDIEKLKQKVLARGLEWIEIA